MFSSRKLFISLIGLGFLGIGYVLPVWLPVLAGLYSTFVSAVIGLVGVYCGMNLGSKHIQKPAISTGKKND